MKHICTLNTMLARSVEQSPDALAFVDGERRLGFREFSERIQRIGNMLLGLGLAKGDRVAVLSRNSIECAELYFAIPCAGLVVVMLNFRLSQGELATVLEDSGAAVLLVGDEYAGYLQWLSQVCRSLRHVIRMGAMDGMEARGGEYGALVEAASRDELEVKVTENDLAALMYTSGTTGIPKGSMVSHRNLYHVGRSMALELRMGADDVGIIPVPMFHASGAVVLMNGIYSGTTTVIMSRWSVSEFIRLVEEFRVSTGLLATPMLDALVLCQNVAPERMTSLKKIIFAGAPVSAVVFEHAVKRFGNIFVHGFGATETLGSVSILRTEQIALALSCNRPQIFASCGKSYADMQAEVVRDNGRRVGVGEVGEIRARGLGVSLGYWRNRRETDRAFRDGWYYTGDLARVDDQGFIYIVGRKRDMIITGGENVFPAEVENILYKHPAVAQAAVIGVADKDWGEAVTAAIVLKEGMRAGEEEIRKFCRRELAGYKVPKSIVFTDSLPTSATGKLMKGRLREKIGLEALPQSLATESPSGCSAAG